MKTRSMLLAAGVFLTVTAHASEQIQICAKATSGKTYAVEATLISGQELIQKTGDLARYQSYSKYVAIFWDQQHVTMINIGGLAAPNAIPLDGTDQEGRHWQVSTGPICI